MWRYYDFEENWPAFLKAWKSDNVQESFEIDRCKWAKLGLFRDYVDGAPLWKESRIMYWTMRILEAASDKIKAENHLSKFEKSMERAGIRYSSKDVLRRAYNKICFKEVYDSCSPKPDSIESFVIPDGKYILQNAMFACAEELFPTEEIEYDMDYVVIVPRLKIVFNLSDYYLKTPIIQE